MDEIKKQEVMDALHESGREISKMFDEYQSMCRSYYSGLEPEEQLMAFCAIVEKLCQGELDEHRSYRGILYDTFGWGPEAYSAAQCAGFLGLHNSIYRFEDLEHVMSNTLKELDITVEPEKLSEALAKHFY
ncbi:hypothetical protein UFOVP71_391 [uncultured Caudovirales phage]|uniref:Uncharacterized protein n=1 Tax=uncultured Caudovirales phage TaxID=2100421 RepID=A0A6J5TAM9_9CAUD|nr:hypothetical protein UFOVP71_391 [uncultured Caudovirales phage]